MKISVNGNIIDTKDIYQITPIEGDNCWQQEGFQRKNQITHSGYCFSIDFFNKKSIRVYMDGSDVFKSDSWNNIYKYDTNGTPIMDGQYGMLHDMEDYNAKLKIIRDKLNSYRDSIVKVWSENQPTIPEYNSEEIHVN